MENLNERHKYMAWYEKINRLQELEIFFKEFLDDDIVKNIQYISIRKRYKKWILLVGINDIQYENKILSYAPQIMKNIREYQSQKDQEIEKKLLPTKMVIFKYDLEEKERKRKRLEEWKNNPYSFLKKTNKQDGIYISKPSFLVKDGFLMPIDSFFPLFKESDKIKYKVVYEDIYDFVVKDRYGKIWKYVSIKTENKIYKNRTFSYYYKFSPETEVVIYFSSKIGYVSLQIKGKIIETTKQTYEKWKKISFEQNLNTF
jgi:hypothetical protein